mmetsp:Transcript_8305/g.15649  ORF Transcript_8305/g.15649 Transcript_8305/m.15649 type:complete len:338 (-) Transcript_8305:36-1049(-)
MKAAIRKGLLGYNLAFSKDFSQPTFSAGGQHKNDVLVKVNAAAINPVDYKVPRALLGPVIGLDFCGIITEVGNNVGDSLKVGDAVFGTTQGSLAEYTIAQSSTIAKVPSDWTLIECAALPVAYQSALQALQRGNIVDKEGSSSDNQQKEKSVLVIGASGGCGIAGIQLCKAINVSRIAAICSKKNEQLVKDMGATEVVDYSDSNQLESFFHDNSGKFDFVFDAATNSGGGEDYWDKSISLLVRDEKNAIVGKFAALNGPASKWTRSILGFEKPYESLFFMKSNSQDLEQIVSLLNRTKARPLTNVMTFDEQGLAEAFKLLKSRRTKGKIVFDVSSSI